MSRILTCIFVFIVGLPAVLKSQEWVEKWQNPATSFYDIQRSFNHHFREFERERSRGLRRNAGREEEESAELAGYQVFKRWAYTMEPRVYPEGNFPDPMQASREMEKFLKSQGSGAEKMSGNWVSLGPAVFQPSSHGEGIARVNHVCVDPFNSQHLFASSASGGLWESTNAGGTWSNTTDQLQTLGFGSTVVDYTNAQIVYAASGDGEYGDAYGLGVLKSLDGGQTWNLTGLNWSNFKNRVARKIIMDPVDHLVLLVSTDGGVYRTADGAVTWTKVSSANIFDIEFNPSDHQVVYAAGDKFYKSIDNGQTFSNITSGLPSFSQVNRMALAVTPANDNYVYILAANKTNSGFYGLYRSTDKGHSFTLRANSPNVMGWDVNGADNGGQSFYTLSVCASPLNPEMVFTGGVNIWKSIDGGATLNLCAHWYGGGGAPYVHADIHDLSYAGNTLYASSDGGVFQSDDDGNSWFYISEGLQATQFYRMGGSEQVPNTIYAGAQDNQSSRYQNGLWQKVRGGDGMEQAINPVNSNIVYSCLQNGGLARSTNGGSSFTDITSGLSGSGGWVTPFALDPAGVLYVGYNQVFRSSDNGNSYTQLASAGGGTIVALTVAPSDPSWIYFARNNVIYRSDNTGASWTNISAGLPVSLAAITYITLDPDNEQRVWVSFSGYSNGNKIYHSADGGLTWSNVSGNLPNIPVNTIAFQKNSNDCIFAGTDAGVFFQNNLFNNWQAYMTGLPNVRVDELEINYSAGKIRAATYGRGLWESDLYMETAPVADFTENKKVICPGQSVVFSDLSQNAVTNRSWNFPGGNPSVSFSPSPVVTYALPGVYDVRLMVSNSTGSDSLLKTAHILVTPNLQAVPFSEDFEGANLLPAGWIGVNPGGDVSWQLSQAAGGFGQSNQAAFFDNLHASNTGEEDAMISTNYDLTTLINPVLSFDVAYARQTPTSKDSLRIEISTDCGDSYDVLYIKGGYSLRTTTTYYPSAFIPLPGEWRKEIISLLPYAGQNSVSFKFINRTAIGNNLFIDNINITQGLGTSEPVPASGGVVIQPNPFREGALFTYTSPDGTLHDLVLHITDITGKVVLIQPVPVSGNQNLVYLQGSLFESGMYFYELWNGPAFLRSGKMIVH